MSLVKPLIIVGSGGSLVTGAYLTKDYWMPEKKKVAPKSISDVLQGKRLISSALSGTALTKQWEEEFESASGAIKTLLGNSNLDKTNGGVALSQWCSNQMSLNADESKTVLDNVEKYCLVRSVSSQLERKSKTLLGSSHTTEWGVTYNKRKDAKSNRGDVGLGGESNWGNTVENTDLGTIKTWCSNNSNQEFLVSESGNSDLYTKVLNWCTEEGG